MSSRPTRSFGSKLIRLVTLTSMVAVGLVCAILATVSYYRGLSLAESSLDALGDTIAIHSTAALAFNDRPAAQETLDALRPLAEIASAQLFTRTGELFAAYRRAQNPAPVFEPLNPGLRYERGWLISEEVIVHKGDRLGALVIAYDLEPLYARLRSNIILALAAGVLATCVAMLLALRLHAELARPVEALAATAATVSDTNDFSLRAPKFADDEIGRLTDAFNAMLQRIGEQAAEIAQTHQQLTATNEELRQKNAEMEQFVYTVSHDLKSPLVTAMGFVGLLKEDAAAGRMPEVMDSVDHIARAAHRMSRLIEDLLSLSRIGRVRNDPEPVDVAQLARQIVDDLGPRIHKAGAAVDIQPEIPRVLVDRARLTQVFENLLVNALKYGSSGPEPRITIGGRATPDDIRYFVRDNGPGIAPEYHERIFGLFQRLSQDREGTGIGLAIVARVMEVQGGRAWVESVPGSGATFWVSFPLAASVTGRAPATRKST